MTFAANSGGADAAASILSRDAQGSSRKYKIMCWKVPEKYRLKYNGGKPGNSFGAFCLPSPDKSRVTKTFLLTIASDGMEGIDWEHVSVRAVKNFNGKQKNYVPTWTEMSFIKSTFWGKEDCVMQLHPPEANYVNDHEFVLHLWRPKTETIPMPQMICV